jgi:hypothetical protein
MPSYKIKVCSDVYQVKIQELNQPNYSFFQESHKPMCR